MEWRPGNATPVGYLLPHYPISGGEENFSEAPPIIRPSYPLIFGLSHCMPLVRNWAYPCGTEYTSRPFFSSRKSVWKFTSSVDCLQPSAETRVFTCGVRAEIACGPCVIVRPLIAHKGSDKQRRGRFRTPETVSQWRHQGLLASPWAGPQWCHSRAVTSVFKASCFYMY